MGRRSESCRKESLCARACAFAHALALLCMCVRAHRERISCALVRPIAIACPYHADPLQALEMSPPPPPTVTVAYAVDGQWHIQRMSVMAVVVFYPSPPAQSFTRRRKEKRPPPRCPSPKILTGVLEELLCASGSDDTLRVERDLHLRLSWIPLLSACRLGGDGPQRERFGKLEHWSALRALARRASSCTSQRNGSSLWCAPSRRTPSPLICGAQFVGFAMQPDSGFACTTRAACVASW